MEEIVLCDGDLADRYHKQIPYAFRYGESYYQGLTFSRKAFESIHDFDFKPNDILVTSYPKSGTTWMVDTVRLILGKGDPAVLKKKAIVETHRFEREISIWRAFKACFSNRKAFSVLLHAIVFKFGQTFGMFGFRKDATKSKEEPRILMTHFPADALPERVQKGACKIIYIARNPKDTAVSFYHFHKGNPRLGKFNFHWHQFFCLYISGNVVYGSWFRHVAGYWNLRKHNKNILCLKFEDMKNHFNKEMYKLCDFLQVELSRETMDNMVEQLQFKTLKKTRVDRAPTANMETFMRKGIVGDWRDHFTVTESELFDKVYEQKMKGVDLEFDC